MTWLEIRAHYIALHARAEAGGVTQRAIAERGGIKGQNSVSRLLANDKLGPSVETFVRAVEGLGMSMAQFFLELEHAGSAGTVADPPAEGAAPATDRLHRIERALEALSVSFSSPSSPSSNRFASSGPAAQAPPGNRDERLTHGDSSLSHGVINHNHIATFDVQRVEAIVKATTESILARLDQVDARMAALGARDGNVPTGPSAVRTGHFG